MYSAVRMPPARSSTEIRAAGRESVSASSAWGAARGRSCGVNGVDEAGSLAGGSSSPGGCAWFAKPTVKSEKANHAAAKNCRAPWRKHERRGRKQLTRADILWVSATVAGNGCYSNSPITGFSTVCPSYKCQARGRIYSGSSGRLPIPGIAMIKARP